LFQISIKICLATATRSHTTVRQVDHITSTSSSSVWACAVCSAIRKWVLLMGFNLLRWNLWGRCVHLFYCLWICFTIVQQEGSPNMHF